MTFAPSPIPPASAPGEVVLKMKDGARLAGVPHILARRRAGGSAVTRTGHAAVDAVLGRAGRPSEIGRVYVSAAGASWLLTDPGRALTDEQWSAEEVAAGLDRLYRVRFDDPAVDVATMVRELEALDEVERASPNGVSEVHGRPDEATAPVDVARMDGPDPGRQWGLFSARFPEAWQITKGYRKLRVAVIDTGVWRQHVDLRDRVADGYDFVHVPGGFSGMTPDGDTVDRDGDPNDDHGHGTHCAGIIAALHDNTVGTYGTCGEVRIVPVRVLAPYKTAQGERRGYGLNTDIWAGMKWAGDLGIGFLSMSLGGTDNSQDYRDVVTYLVKKCVQVVASTGNDATTDSRYPAAIDGVLAVGAIDPSGGRAPYSNYGPVYRDFVVAPGTGVLSSVPGGDTGRWEYWSGTSMAAPHVTGLLVLLGAKKTRDGEVPEPNCVIEALLGCIRAGATLPAGKSKPDRELGHGTVDARRSLEIQGGG